MIVGVLGDQRIVQLEEIDMVAPHALQAVLHALRDRLADIGAMLDAEPHLGADDHVGLQRLQHAAEVLLGFAVAVERRGVEVVDAGLYGARRGALLVGRPALGEQSADRSCAVAQD